MNEYLKPRDIKILKSNITSGIFDGTLFGLCWGSLYGPALQYQQGISGQQYRNQVLKYMGKSIVKGAPLVAMARIIGDVCESKQLGQVPQLAITFTFAIAYLTLVRFP